MSDFAELLQELQGEQEAMAKALPADDGDGDEKIAAAAAEGGSQGVGEPDGDEEKDPKVGDADGDEKPMAKSFKVTLEDGTEAEAVDAGALVKSLQDQVGALSGQLSKTEESLAKSLGTTLELVKGQQTLIKSLTDRVNKLSSTGAGRKSTVVVHEKPAGEPAGALAKSQAAAASPAEFLLKSNAAFEAGKLTGLELTTIDVSLRGGQAIPTELIQKVIGA